MTDRGVEAAGRATVGVGARGLVFREKELERLSAALQTAREGGSDVILIGGPTGIGKTALVERMRASAIDFSVLELQGVEEECEIAFAGLFELLAPVLDLRAGLPEPQREALEGALALAPAAGSDQFAVLAATLGLLANAAEAGPLLVIVEDLQWVDEASVSAILFAMRRLGADGIAAVITRRNDEESGHDPRGLDELELRPLPPAEGEVLLRTLASVQVAPDVATAVVTEASGNPMLIAHAAELLSPEQLAGHELLPEPLPISEVMAATIERRAADLGEDAMRALTLVAAAGADRRLEVLAAALTDIDLDVAILEEADEAGHIRIEVERVEFNDPLLRSTVYQRASARDRRLAHAALARALPGSEMAERTAWHLAKATIGPDEQTAAALADAGRSAADRGGHAAAAKALERAAALTTTPALRGERLVMAAREANLAGRPQRAAELTEAALEIGDDTVRADAIHTRGRVGAWSAPPAEVHTALVSEAERVARDDPARAGTMLADAALPLIRAGDVETGLETARRGAQLAKEAGADGAKAELVFAISLVVSGRSREATPLVDRWVEKLRLEDPMLSAHEPWHAVPRALVWMERYEEARELLELFAAQARRCAPGALPFTLGTIAEVDYRTGRLPTARAAASEGATLAHDLGQPIGAAFCLASLARVAAVTGRDEDCRAAADEALRIGRRLGGETPIKTLGAPALGLLALGRGDPEAAVEHLEAVAAASEKRGLREPAMVQYRPNLVEALIRSNRRDEAEEALLELERQAEATGRTWALAAAARCRGLLADDPDEFVPLFDAALSWHAQAPAPLEQARTELCLGERLRRARRRAAAREHLRAAESEFERHGAEPWVALARRELGASGEKARRRSEPRSDELTPQELQVALLVSSGATNKEAAGSLFLSAKTIEAHLGRIYRKLGIRSRTELAALASRNELAPA